jgi:hypothetical protein
MPGFCHAMPCRAMPCQRLLLLPAVGFLPALIFCGGDGDGNSCFLLLLLIPLLPLLSDGQTDKWRQMVSSGAATKPPNKKAITNWKKSHMQ